MDECLDESLRPLIVSHSETLSHIDFRVGARYGVPLAERKKLVGLSDPSKPVVHKVGDHYRNFRLLNRNELAHHSQGQSPIILACRVYFVHQPTRTSSIYQIRWWSTRDRTAAKLKE